MQGTVLLSEIHPLAWQKFNPVMQAHTWFGLLTPTDIAKLQQQRTKFSDAIALIERRSRDRGDSLVLRDWNHLDYTGYPFITSPGYHPLLFMELAGDFNIIRLSIARDPVAQWLSLMQYLVTFDMLKPEPLDLDQFLLGYRKYAELCVETGFIRYEDFLQKPELTMRETCDRLQISFDPNFIDNWHEYKTITGDVISTRGGNEIKPLPPPSVQPALKEKFLANADYHRAIELLGYNSVS
jgi:hypothetical protein